MVDVPENEDAWVKLSNPTVSIVTVVMSWRLEALVSGGTRMHLYLGNMHIERIEIFTALSIWHCIGEGSFAKCTMAIKHKTLSEAMGEFEKVIINHLLGRE